MAQDGQNVRIPRSIKTMAPNTTSAITDVCIGESLLCRPLSCAINNSVMEPSPLWCWCLFTLKCDNDVILAER